MVRADVHQGGDGGTRTAHGVALEPLANLIEHHDQHRLGVFSDAESTDSGHRHQEIFVENLPAQDIPECPPQHVAAGEQIGDKEQEQAEDSAGRNQHRGEKQRGAGKNAAEGLDLFAAHVRFPLSWDRDQARMIQLGSIFRQMAAALRRISSMRDSSASIVSFCVIKLTETFCTPPSLRIALSILAAQLAQSSPSSFQVFFIRQASFPSLIVRDGYVYKQDKAICRAAGYSATCSIPCPRMVRTCPSARE